MCDHTMGCDECGEQTCELCLKACEVCLNEFCMRCITRLEGSEGETLNGHVCSGELEEEG